MQDQQEFTELLRANLPAIHRFVVRMVGNHVDAEDIVQETALKAFLHFTDFRVEAKFRTWLISIARNALRGRRRRESTLRLSYFEPHQLELMASAGSADSPYRQYEEKERNQMLEDAVATLHPCEKNVIRLRVLADCNVADAARRLSISIPATK